MKHISVLIVDNHKGTRTALAKILSLDKRLKIVGEAANGKEAIAKVKELFPEVVLMDIKMPKMDGLQATRCIKESHPEIRIIMLSAYGEKGLVNEAIKLGASAYLIKNCQIEDIIQIIVDEHEAPETKQSAG